MNPNTRKVSHTDIKNWVGLSSFQKGMEYFGRGAIFETRLQGQTLKGHCRGSQANSYRVQATLEPAGITSAMCSCPVGTEGRCKHVAALLLTWTDLSESFKEIDLLPEALKKHSKAELIAIIQLMILREPDLELLLEMPLPGVETGDKPVDTQAIRRQAEYAFRGHGGKWDMGWGDPYEIVEQLQPLFNLATEYQKLDHPVDAATVYQVIAKTIMDFDDAVMLDDEGYLGGAIIECAEDLGECLVSISDPGERENILKALFAIYVWDVKAGGIGVGENVPDILQEHTIGAERQMISDWIEKIMPGMEDWARQIVGGLLLELQSDTIDDETFLQVCRQSGRLIDLVDRLLTLGRTEEAAGEARRASDYDLLGSAGLFVDHGHNLLAESLIRDRETTSPDPRLTEWRKEYAKNRGDLSEALELAEKLFWMRPTMAAYEDIRQLAQPLNRWPDLRIRILESLGQAAKFVLLTEIFLEEGEIDRAIEFSGSGKEIHVPLGK